MAAFQADFILSDKIWAKYMARRKSFFGRQFGESPEVDPNLWLVPYGDLMTNMMLFFLLLFALTARAPKNVVQQAEDQQLIVKKLEEFGTTTVSADKINVTFSQDIIFKVGKAEIFKTGKAEITKNFAGAMEVVSSYLKDNSRIVIVSGHADSTPLHGGKYKDNWFLSAERGWSVANELIKNGIDPKRIQIRGYGEFNPVASNSTAKGRAKNRRIEMTILKIKMEEAKRFIYYKTTEAENVAEISKKILGNENFSQQIKELNSGKIDDKGTVLKDTEILLPFNSQ
jgi:flagellar motor protein MotB